MTEKEWLEIKEDYLVNSQEFHLMYGENIMIILCWSDNPFFPYEVNVVSRKKRRHFWGYKHKLISSEDFSSQEKVLSDFKIDGKTLDEIYPDLD